MKIQYNAEYLQAFKAAAFKEQGPVGIVPSEWVEDMAIDIGSLPALPERQLTRDEVREICQEHPDSLYGYICSMAWGAQGLGPSGAKHPQNAWKKKETIRVILQRLRGKREKKLSRKEAYELFTGANKIEGLGPAYFTKLLYFFGPDRDHYIMDQWTVKSVILLTGQHIVRHTRLGPTDHNTGVNYELFCRVIDDLAQKLEAKGKGEEIEQRLFSVGSLSRQPRGAWRKIVHEGWDNRPKLGRYDPEAVEAWLRDGDVSGWSEV